MIECLGFKILHLVCERGELLPFAQKTIKLYLFNGHVGVPPKNFKAVELPCPPEITHSASSKCPQSSLKSGIFGKY